MLQKDYVPIYTASCLDGINITNWEEQSHPTSRGTRAVDHSTRYLLVTVNKKVEDRVLRPTIARWVHEGIDRNGDVSVYIPCSRCSSCFNLLHRYRFLGYTESQVKAGKLMFFCEGDDWTVERLLESFGNLPAVYLKSGYGKYAARLGMSFSSTVQSLDVRMLPIFLLPDMNPKVWLSTDPPRVRN